jgi:hypothetical protein
MLKQAFQAPCTGGERRTDGVTLTRFPSSATVVALGAENKTEDLILRSQAWRVIVLDVRCIQTGQPLPAQKNVVGGPSWSASRLDLRNV